MDALGTALTTRMPDPSVPSGLDADLARAAATGDTQAFESLYRRHLPRIHGVVLRLCGHDMARAEELTQEAFVTAWRKLEGFRHQSAFGTWMYRLAVNTALMGLRAQRADPVTARDPAQLPENGEQPFCAAEREELERAIGRLPERARAVLVLHDVEGWRHDEIGKSLGIATGTSKAQLHRARALLRNALGERP